VAAAAYGEGRAEHRHEGERQPQRGERFPEQRLREHRDQHRGDVEQRSRPGDARPGDPELVCHLEQRDQRAAAHPDEQQGGAVDAKEVAVEQQAVGDERQRAEQDAPEPDPGDRGALAVEGGAQGARGSPGGAGRERKQVAGQTRDAGDR